MAWYAYCITEQSALLSGTRTRRPFPIPGMQGIRGKQVVGYPSGDFAVVVSDYAPDGTLDQQSVLDHARVVSECFRSGTVLPFRFGTVFHSDEALRRAVRTNRRALTDSVLRLRGKSEMHLKLVIRDESLREKVTDTVLPQCGGKRISVAVARQGRAPAGMPEQGPGDLGPGS